MSASFSSLSVSTWGRKGTSQVTSKKKMSNVAYQNESCHAYRRVVSHKGMTHVTHEKGKKEKKSEIKISRFTHMERVHESCHIKE